MNNLFLKKKLTIQGAGGGSKGGQAPPPPDVTQYPAVLAPPQFSNLNTINSFSYAEIIDLISDGPIEGLINRNGKKVYDENIFEGIFLNDTPIKETSSEKKQSIPISFLKERLKKHWYYVGVNADNKLIVSLPRITTINTSEIDDINFSNPISITSYHPSDSIFQFIKSLNGSFDAVSLISKAFDLSPIINEKPFLTKINIPKFTINLSKDKFDINEGGTDSPSPLKIGMTDLSNYIYFSIGSETLNSFNYFELPRSFISNNSSTVAGKKTFKKNLISSTEFYKYEIYDLSIYIWSIYNEEVGIKNIDEILDRYFNNIYVFQNDFSLFNYNLIQSEFKNGSEVQAPLKYFTNVEIDTEYGKELVGPYKICNCFNPNNALDNGGIQRVKSFGVTNSYTLPALTTLIEDETSDDIRYVQSWPIEYDKKGAPYLICDVKLNYTQFDKTSSSRTNQEAVPITHYIANENVEEIFVSLNVQQLYDTNHVDLVSKNTDTLGLQGKLGQTTVTPEGINTYGSVVGFNNTLGYIIGNIYFLIYGSNSTNGYVLDGVKTTDSAFNDNLLICNLQRVVDKNNTQTLYYNTISADGLASKIPSISTLIGGDSTSKAIWKADINNNLINYQLPNDSYIIRESFNINGYSISSLESKLKLLNEDQSPLYCFGLAANEKITSTSIDAYVIPTTSNIIGTTNKISSYLSSSEKAIGYDFYIAKVQYRTAAIKELAEKATVAHIINHYIDWNLIIDKSQSTWKPSSLISEINYPNIFKYIINPYLNLNKLKYGETKTSYLESIIGYLYLVGINGSYLRSQTSFFKDSTLTYLKLTILDQLLEEFLLVTDQSSSFKNIESNNGSTYISDYSTTKALENSLLKFQNGKLIGSSSVYNLKKYTIATVPYESNVNSIDFDKNKTNETKQTYNLNNIFLYRTQYISINTDDAKYDVIFYYNLYSNIAQNSSLVPNNSDVKYYNMEMNSDGSQTQAVGNSLASAAKQNITAGTKLPAIIVVDVETGYESKEKEIYRGSCEYFSYRYNIFGMSTDSAIIDLGRKSYDFVNACKTSLDRGGYVSKYRNIYNENQPVYLFELVCCCSQLLTSTTGYYLTNKKEIYIGDINLTAIESDPNYSISYITYFGSNIGSEQQFSANFNALINGASTQITNINTIALNYSCATNYLKNNLLSNQQVLDFFNGNFQCLDLARSVSFLRNPNNDIANKMIADKLYIIEPYVFSKSVSTNNICYFDTYKYIDNANQACLQLKIYNYFYTSYQTVFINPLWLASTVANKSYINYVASDTTKNIDSETQNVNLVIYIDETSKLNSPSSIVLTLKSKFSSDLFLSFNGFVARFTNSTVNNTDVYNALVSYFPVINTWSNNISSGITAPLDENIKNELINNIEYINSELFAKNILNSENLIITPSNLKEVLSNASLIYSTVTAPKVTNNIAGFLVQFLLLSKTGSRYFSIKNSNTVSVKAIDKREYLGSLTIKDPVSISANFWTIYSVKTKKITILFKKPIRNNLYSDLSSYDSNSFLLNDLVSQNNTFPFRLDWYPYIDNNNNGFGITFTQVIKFYNSKIPEITQTPAPYWYRRDKTYTSWLYYTYVSFPSTYTLTAVYRRDPDSYSEYIDDYSKPYTVVSYATNRANSYYYYDLLFKNGAINTFNYELNKVTTLELLTVDCPIESDTLKYVEKAFIEQGFLPPDMRMFSYLTSPVNRYEGANEIFSWFEGIGISNVSYNTKNTYANDAGVRIQIPVAKNDKYGNPMRRYVKITRRSHETLSPLIGKKISLNKVTEIIPQKFSYPFSSIVGTKIDSRAFSQIPTRTFHCKLKKVLVPSNYFPNNEDEEDVRYLEGNGKHRIYEGDWNGTFKLAWSNNPAWILMDLLINKRYGLGNYIESDQVDIWELYKISRWCDCVDDNGYYYGVSDGFGGVEPRHSFNALISDKFNIFDMVNQVASVFRGHVYYMNSLITFDDDRIKPIIGEFNNYDVKDGLFNYTNHKKDDEFTAVDIAYIDARDNYKPKIEYIEDSDGIRQRGILKKNMNAFGVTSKAQARRFGKYFLYQTSKENTNITFTTDNRALLYKPGDLIRINDELMNSIKNFGQIKKIVNNNNDCFTVTIDKILNSGTYIDTEISLYVPVAKPKYDDYYANAQFVPENLIFCTSSPILGSVKTRNSGIIITDDGFTYDGLYCKSIYGSHVEFKMNAFDTSSPIKSFIGITDVAYKIETLNPVAIKTQTISETAYLTYIQNSNINGEPAKYGYWQFTMGLIGNQDKLIFDVLENESLKYQLPYKNYFFEYFDTGRYLRFSGVNEFNMDYYNTIDFDPRQICLWNNLPNDNTHTGIVYQNSISNFSISSYKDPVITYNNIIENDRPSIDTFSILGYTTGNYTYNNEVYNEYTELVLSKSGKSPKSNGEFDQYKSSVSVDLSKLLVGSTYSLNLLNNKDKIYKVMAITENYINEYNILASEYNLDKFKEIEDNSEIDNLQNTFNFLTAQSQALQVSEKDRLAAPVISSLRYISNLHAIEIKWNSVQNADSYDIYIQTPSKQTSNFITKAYYNTDYNKNISSFLKIWYLPENSEIGTYTISIQSNAAAAAISSYQFSAIAKRSINILNY
jgi:hypothetical protein